jgi:hypothetical protein
LVRVVGARVVVVASDTNWLGGTSTEVKLTHIAPHLEDTISGQSRPFSCRIIAFNTRCQSRESGDVVAAGLLIGIVDIDIYADRCGRYMPLGTQSFCLPCSQPTQCMSSLRQAW